MNDRGEKIVSLARELLKNDVQIAPEAADLKISLSFKALCLTTILTAFGSCAVTSWANETHRPLNRYERTELEALIFYTVHTRGLKEDALREVIRQDLGVHTFDDMTESDYIIAKRYLQNIAQ